MKPPVLAACAALTLAALALAALPLPAAARDIIAVAPVYSQLVAFPVPSGFKAVYEGEDKGSYLLEFVPQGEAVDNWTQMLTLTGLKDGAKAQSVIDFASGLAKGYQDACPGSFAARNLQAPQIKGAGEVFAGYLGCGDSGGHSEEMTFLVLHGTADLYTVQWALRGPAHDAAPAPKAEDWMPRSAALALTRICEKVPGEVAPYPSCTR